MEDRDRGPVSRDKSKFVEIAPRKGGSDDTQNVPQKQSPGVTKSKAKKEMSYIRDGKVSSVYQSISGRVLGNKSETANMDIDDLKQESRLPPPPPPARRIPLQVMH